MSNVNIRRAVENIRSGTSIYTPIVELTVNAIQAIEQADIRDGLVEIVVNRNGQRDFDGSISDIVGFTIIDNGCGFVDENRNSFDTLYTAQKISEGGKGFGRFTCLKYFDDVFIESVYRSGRSYFSRKFKMGKENDIIVDETVMPTGQTRSGSKIRLISIKNSSFPDKQLGTIARTLFEKLLPYFYSIDKLPPKVMLREEDESERILLNDYIENRGALLIKEVVLGDAKFSIRGNNGIENFDARVFKFYSPRTQTSKVSLVAHRREVTSTSLHRYIPEFVDEFFDGGLSEGESKDRNFIVKVYVFGDYLDNNVCLERGGFEFQKESDALYGISQTDIEGHAAQLAKLAVDVEVDARIQKKRVRVEEYVKEKAPWHLGILGEVDLTDLAYNATDDQIESKLQRKKYDQEMRIRNEVRILLEEGNPDDLKSKASEIVRLITGNSKNDLVHYVALRRSVIDVFQKSLELDGEGEYSSEGIVHDIIFPRKSDSKRTDFDEHNLWLIDERLNFTEYISSDLPLRGNADRPDLIAYDKRVVFRGENEASNPVTIFEFKKPQRDDFVNPSSDEDPVQQVVRYVRKLRAGEFKTPLGREILISENTPFYGYVVCDLTTKVRCWLEEEKDFKPMPDRLGYFRWHENLNLYIEVLGWDKVLKDATMRNRIFFHKLGI